MDILNKTNTTWGASKEDSGVTFVVVQGWDELKQIVAAARELDNPHEVEIGDDDDEDIESALQIIFGHDNIDWGFADEYTSCGGCHEIFRITPSSYGDIPQYVETDGDVFCGECVINVESLTEDYITSLTNNTLKANVIRGMEEKLKERGFKKLDEIYESGFHYGQNDRPIEIFERLKSSWPQIIFSIKDKGQFDVRYEAWVK